MGVEGLLLGNRADVAIIALEPFGRLIQLLLSFAIRVVMAAAS